MSEQVFVKCKGCPVGFWRDEKSRQEYHSNACKQRAYNAAKRDKRLPLPQDGMSPSEKAIQTKAAQSFTRTCKGCGCYFIVDGFHTKQEYHDDACKQRAYRERKKRYEEWHGSSGKEVQYMCHTSGKEVDPMVALNDQLERAMKMMEVVDGNGN